jgi:1-acyl-sn-glycerol-3-phosphate acyltransferase
MAYLRGLLRFVSASLIVVAGTLGVVLLSWVPLKRSDIRLSAWVFSYGVRLLMPALGLRFECTDCDRIVEHHGFIFSNHVSFFDVLVMAYLLPVRFVAKAEVKKWPFIGAIASATGSLFVDRSDKNNRSSVRQQVADAILATQYPPVVIFPEGTRNPLDTLLPFRYGVFDIAIETEAPYLLCAIHYEQTEAMTWHSRNEGLLTTVKRIVLKDTSRVWLAPLHVVQPRIGDDSARLAAEAREIIGAALTQMRAGADPVTTVH